MNVSRRGLLGLLGAAVAAPAVQSQTCDSSLGFVHGVASGDPAADGFVIWTRISRLDTELRPDPVTLAWQVAEDATFRRVVKQGEVSASADRDFTAKVAVTGLQSGREYHYRFAAGTAILQDSQLVVETMPNSPTGRARTLPVGATAQVVFAVANCALYPGGYFNAYGAIARETRLDAVIHLGDYIYEYGAAERDYGMEIGRAIGRAPDPPHELSSLDDYRRRYAQAHTDEQLQAAHARAAFICIWDDHETADNSWTGGAVNHQADEGPWDRRKRDAVRAWYEWMPVREPAPGAAAEAINRIFHYGDLVTLLMTESRLVGRGVQIDYASLTDPDDAAALAAFRARIDDPSRQLLGAAQEDWMAGELAASVRSGRRWQVIGNQVVMGRVFSPDFQAALGAERYEALVAREGPGLRRYLDRQNRLARYHLPYNLDSWDGYPAARERFYTGVKTANARPIVLSGDSHAFWANDLHDAFGARVAAEFGATAVTSPGLEGFGDVPLAQAYADASDEVIFTDMSSKGYLRLTLTRRAVRADMVAVSTIRSQTYEVSTVKSFEVVPNGAGLSGPRQL